MRWLAGVLVVAVLLGLGYWAGRVTLRPPAPSAADVDTVLATVVEASVGRSLSLNVTVEQPFVPIAANALTGTVTAVGAADQVAVGDSLYSVDTVPVRAVVGETPFWRDLSSGAEGDDVAQLQRALVELGHFSGEDDGRFQAATGEAVRAWQRSLGIPADGVVRLGELVAVPELPAALGLAEEIVPGVRLTGGEPAVSGATGDIDFRLVVSPGQEGMIPPDATVSVEHEEHVWEGVLGEPVTGDDGNVHYRVDAPGGGLLCGDDCDSLPAVERTALRAGVTIIPEVTGPAVPVAAVRTDPDGSTWVADADGERREVSVLGSSGGVAVVDGLTVGEQVRVFDDGGDGGAAGQPGALPVGASPSGR